MPFNTLLLHSLIHATSVNENGVRAIAQQQEGERILFFHIDSAFVRIAWAMPRGEGLCDYLVLYSKESNKPEERKKVLCLLELKGKDIVHATKQIIDTYKRIQELLKLNQHHAPIQHIIWKAYICFNAHSPISQTKSSINELKRIFKSEKHFDIVRDKGTDKRENFGEFLRK